MRLSGKVAIVTGTSPNIGGALARGLAAEGARVACNDVRAEVAERCVAEIRAAGGEALAIPGDVTDPEAVEGAVQAVVGEWGGVDILVNNAVWFNAKGLLTMPVEEFRRQVDIILGGAFLFTASVAKDMIERHRAGSIVNVLSTAAWQGQPGNVGYCTAKSGLLNFTRSVAMELAEHGIRVNNFTPTATQPEDADLLRAVTERRAAERGSKYATDFAVPLGRLPTPSDYVPAVVYLASDESRLVTGTNITVDGGALAKYWPWTPGPSTAAT